MFEIFLTPEALPFSVALAVTAGLFVLEIISALLGATILGIGSEGPDLDVDPDFDLTVEIDLDAVDLDADVDAADAPNSPSDVLGWLGARDVPFLIWLVSFLTMFGLSGLLVQSVAHSVFGTPLPTWIAVFIAMVPAILITRVIANHVALIMPKTETSALRTPLSGWPSRHDHSGYSDARQARRGQDQGSAWQLSLPTRRAIGGRWRLSPGQRCYPHPQARRQVFCNLTHFFLI